MRILLPLLMVGCVTAAYAEDGVTGRPDCGGMMDRIGELSAKSDRTVDEVGELKSLRAKYSAQCQASSDVTKARRANARSLSSMLAARAAPTTPAQDKNETSDNEIDTFLQKKQENCQQLNSAIEKLKSANAPDAAEIAKMQAQYDADCTERAADDAKKDTDVAELTPEEIEAAAVAEAERIAKLIEQGLCADGTKPNKYGCCAGEKFRDLGNLEFACCREDSDECFPPIEK